MEVSNLESGRFELKAFGNVAPKLNGGYYDFVGSHDIKFPIGFTMEAWINPDQLGGRIWDKITPGRPDGLLLDLHGGLRFICGSTVIMAEKAPKNR